MDTVTTILIWATFVVPALMVAAVAFSSLLEAFRIGRKFEAPSHSGR